MRKLKACLMAIGSAALLQPFVGQANELQSAVERLTPEMLQDQIESITELPITGAFAAQAQGEIYFISSDGRFVFSGRAHDLWYDQPLNTMANHRCVSDNVGFDANGRG